MRSYFKISTESVPQIGVDKCPSPGKMVGVSGDSEIDTARQDWNSDLARKALPSAKLPGRKRQDANID